MLRKRMSVGKMANSCNRGHEFWLSPIGLQFHLSESAEGRYNNWELFISAEALDNVILLVAKYGNCIAHLYLGATVNTMYELYRSLEEKKGLDFICVITDKKKRYVQYMRRFFLQEEFLTCMLLELNTFSPVIDTYMDNMNKSRQPHEFICKKLLEQKGTKVESQ